MEINKIIAKLPPGFVDDVAGFDEERMRNEIVKADARLAEIKREMKADEKLNGAREIVKDLAGGYNDAKKAQAAKIEYLLHVLEERGHPVDTGSEG